MVESERFLMNVKQSLSKLSKLRFAEIVKNESYQSTYLNAWPLYYDDKNIDVLEYLKRKGIYPNKEPFVRVIDVPYAAYSESNKILGYEGLRAKVTFLRNYVEVRRIELSAKKDIEVSIAYDPNKTRLEELPLNTDDYISIKEISERSDILFSFASTSESWQAKVKGYLGCFILYQMKLFPNKELKHIDRNNIKSDKIKRGDKSNRFVTNNPKHFKSIVELTEKNIKKSMNFEPWAKQLKKVTLDNELNKKRK